MSELRIVLSTCPSQEKGAEIAEILVSERLAACVNILPIHQSVYEWEGKICKDSEVLLVIKSSLQTVPALEKRLKDIHPYTVPEFVVLGAEYVSKSYESWALGVLKLSQRVQR